MTPPDVVPPAAFALVVLPALTAYMFERVLDHRFIEQHTVRFDEFAARYRAELAGNPALGRLRELVAAHPVVEVVHGVPPEVGVVRDLRRCRYVDGSRIGGDP